MDFTNFAGDVLLVRAGEPIRAEAHGLCLAVLAVVDHQLSARRAVNDDSIGPPPVLLSIERQT